MQSIKLSAVVNKIMDLVFLTIYWLVCCIPVFTIGAATTALYYTMQKVIKNDRGYAAGEYWSAFKSNFKVSTLCWLIHLALGFLFADECYICYQMWADGDPVGWLWLLFALLEAINVMMALFTFPYIARFDDRVGRTMKNSLFIMLLNLPKAVLQLLLIAMFVYCIYRFVPVILIAPAAYMLLSTYLLEKTFRKYMSKEDLAAEQERNAAVQ